MFGEAMHSKQLLRMGMSAVAWEILRIGAQKALLRSGKFPADVARELGISFACTIHAIIASVLSLYLVAVESRPDSLYRRFDLAQVTYAISSGFFAWDLYAVLFVDKFDVGFLIHAVSCLLCYVFGQFPFLNYWGAYFLLFELSTPLLHLRKAMLLTGNKSSPWFAFVEKAFALAFFVARIAVGIPMSAMVWQDLLDLLKSPHKVHSHFVVYFYLVANTALCGLNVFWFWNMVKKKLAGAGSKKIKPT